MTAHDNLAASVYQQPRVLGMHPGAYFQAHKMLQICGTLFKDVLAIFKVAQHMPAHDNLAASVCQQMRVLGMHPEAHFQENKMLQIYGTLVKDV